MAAIHADTSGIHYRRKAYIVAFDNMCRYQPFFSQAKRTTIYAIRFDTNCDLRSNMPSTLKHTIARKLKMAMVLKYLYTIKNNKSQRSAAIVLLL